MMAEESVTPDQEGDGGPLPEPEPEPERQPERDLFGRTPKGRQDWSHRRGEPRVLVLCWSMYLLGTLAVSFGPLAGSSSTSIEAYRQASRSLSVYWMIGLFLLAPALRLCQVVSKRPMLAAARDLLVLWVPVAALTLVQAISTLSDWPLAVVAAEASAMGAWAAVAMGVVALAAWLEPAVGAAIARLGAAAVLVIAALGVPAVLLAGGWLSLFEPRAVGAAAAGADRAAMLSPLTAVWEVMRDRAWTGQPADVDAGHWRAIRVTFAVAIVPWVLAAIAGAVVSSSRGPADTGVGTGGGRPESV